MHLNRLCLILPADVDELLPYEPSQVPSHPQKKAEKHSHRSCGDHVLAFIRDSLCRLYCRDVPRKQHSGVFYDLEGIQLSEKVGRDSPRTFSYAELYIGTKGFSEDEVLGSGGFGKVYRAVLPSDGTLVAVKCLAEKGEKFEKTFAAELVAVAHLRHRNLVRLRGWCVHEDQLLLVYDYMPNRSLDRVLFRRPENLTAAAPLDWERRRAIVGGLAAALHYLHEQLETQIIHRDVKTSNVMLDSQYNAKLGDFGLARWLEHELEYQTKETATTPMKDYQFRLAETTRIGGTIGYLPPESFQKRTVATAKSDVFSFGIVVLEIVSGRRAVDLTYPDEQIILLDWMRRLSDEGKLLAAGDTRLRDGSYSLSDMERLIHLGLLCTLHNPQSRPNMKWVVESLSGMISGKLPALPSFQSHPPYITISSDSNTSTSNTITIRISTTTASSNMTDTSTSTKYVTAVGETIYETAEPENGGFSSSYNKSQRRSTHFMVETPREISYKEITYATNNFSESRRVAELDFGTAYLGFLENHQSVLVKRLGMTKCPALRTRFSNELQNLARLRHRNLVQLRGWCTEQGEMLVVYDYSANRFLSHLLFYQEYRIGHSIFPWYYRYNIVKSLASAVLYLHEEWEQQVIHRNITSSAVILDQDMNPRLSNFALAEFLTQNDHDHHAATDKTKSVRGIFGYMSPEYVESGEATTMADVYSFGVVLLEIVSGQMAVDFRRPEVLLVKRVHEFEAMDNSLEDLVDVRLDGEYNHTQVMRVMKIGIACTRSKAELRPNMRQIVSMLDGNEECFMLQEQGKESRDEWKDKNASALSLVRRIQALGIQ
ncbi:receptor like protein kinase S.2 [Tripterygium wilfordii]|uniref:Receptor like protein kinase S.2 n=1 Tax=Tripterygium wilfordii TaxID=458696 RepID=A0A7J7E1K3_TRIWF|nr:receptor like protein kinase S.2 [Tripterygium wilfordii]KAF5752485.1 receptor like protein kinase S.2 [Tripterygium wilfordii]